MKKWDLRKGVLTINGVVILGVKKGDFITAKYSEKRNTIHMSADNYGRHSANPNQDGTVMIGVTEGAPATTVIQQFVDTGEPLVISYVDYTSPGAFVMAMDALIDEEPEFKRSEEVQDVDWTFICTKLSYKHASAAAS